MFGLQDRLRQAFKILIGNAVDNYQIYEEINGGEYYLPCIIIGATVNGLLEHEIGVYNASVKITIRTPADMEMAINKHREVVGNVINLFYEHNVKHEISGLVDELCIYCIEINSVNEEIQSVERIYETNILLDVISSNVKVN